MMVFLAILNRQALAGLVIVIITKLMFCFVLFFFSELLLSPDCLVSELSKAMQMTAQIPGLGFHL